MDSSSDRRAAVVNVRTSRCDTYVGRGTPFGNPYVIGPDGDRREVVRKFRIHFGERLRLDPAFRTLVLGLKGRTLGCHCAPLSCHGDVIAAYLNGVDF